MGEGVNLSEEYNDLPIRILSPSTRRLMSIHLDPPAVIPSSHGVLGDMSGLAELAGFEFCHIRYFETKYSRTFACLEEWGLRHSGTIGNLLKNLVIMERFDCLSEIRESVLRDIKNHIERTTRNSEMVLNIGNIDNENNLGSSTACKTVTSLNTDLKVVGENNLSDNCLPSINTDKKVIGANNFSDNCLPSLNIDKNVFGENNLSDNCLQEDEGYRTCSLNDEELRSLINGNENEAVNLQQVDSVESTISRISRENTSITDHNRNETTKLANINNTGDIEINIRCAVENKKRGTVENSKIKKLDKVEDTERSICADDGVRYLVPRPVSPVYEDDGFLTTDDREGFLKRYSACICCADENINLANEIIMKYKDQNADFFLPQEALLSGKYEFETLAEVIETRCDSRLIVILSKHYLTSPACVFATQFVKTLDPDAKRRKIIPVLLDEDVSYPRVLRGISSIKARRLKFGHGFWNLLGSSLRLKKVINDEEINNANKLNMNSFDKTDQFCLHKQCDATQQMEKSEKNNSFQQQMDHLNSTEKMSCVLTNDFPSDKPAMSVACCDLPSGASGICQKEQYASLTTGKKDKKNPGLKTLRRIMKSLNIIDRKPKLQYTKRSHSTGEAIPQPTHAHVEPRSHSTNVPPTMDTYLSDELAHTCSSPIFNICHTESELTLSSDSDTLSAQDSTNNLSSCEYSEIKNDLSNDLQNLHKKSNANSSGQSSGQNILSPNIEPLSPKDLTTETNNLDSTSRQPARDDNVIPDTGSTSYDTTSLLSEVTSSDNNSIVSNSRKESLDNCSYASSFRQMKFGNDSRQTSFESNRSASFDGNSMTSIEDNMAADKQTGFFSCEQIVSSDKGTRRKSGVVFEIML
ncbi:uncharacterized protein LOC127729104 [Mytilus californianus]|uniref:uncharacterized protein LOC127729104 n=1 Tax=Mytilus californianus TaxID=6549 RepID=UPI002247C4F3|nr:uncharacterized protein LOC127729104 [Mytilus californianus]